MAIELTIDQRGWAKFSRFGKQVQKQLPYAASLALNALAGGSDKIPQSKERNIRKALAGASRGYFDQPTNFIQNAWFQTYAKPRDLQLTIYAEERRVKYLKAHIQGGARTYKKYEAKLLGLGNQSTQALIPAFVKLNGAGNVTKGTIGKIISAQGASGAGSVFVGKPLGGNRPTGIYERTKAGTLKPLFVAQPRAYYRGDFPLERTAWTVQSRRFGTYLDAALELALATAR